MKSIAIIQARLGSSRLPGKVLLPLGDKTVLEQVYKRVRKINGLDEVIVATTTAEKDDELAIFMGKKGIPFFRGSEEDVLARFYEVAKRYEADAIMRITSDCPLLDPKVSEKMLEIFSDYSYDMVSNASENPKNRTFPRGLDTEIFMFQWLEKAYQEANKPYQREHVTPYLYENVENIYFHKNEEDYSKYRWTLDTREDYALIRKVYEELERTKIETFQEIVAFLEKNPEVLNLNAHIEQKGLEG